MPDAGLIRAAPPRPTSARPDGVAIERGREPSAKHAASYWRSASIGSSIAALRAG
jgi:hypothetical protein